MGKMRRSLGSGGVLLVIAAVSIHLAAANGERHGIDIAGMDRSVAPGDDFYRYANGAWMSSTEIPSDRSRWGVFDVLGDASLQRTHQILERAASSSAPGTIERTVGDYYASVLDEAGVEARGIAPLGPALARVKAIDTRTALARVLGDDLRADVDPLNNTNFHTDRLFGLWVAPDVNDSSRNAPYLLQGGLDLPDREYYLADSPKMADIRTAFRGHVERVLALAGETARVPERAAAIVALETQMARVHATRLESLAVTRANNPWPVAEFPARAPGLDWPAFFEAAHLTSVTRVIAWHPAAIA